MAIEGEQPDGVKINLEAMKGSLKKKGTGMAKSKGLEKKDKKTATFAEAAGKGTAQRPEAEVKYNKCIVAFAIRVKKGRILKEHLIRKLSLPYPVFKTTSTSMPPFSPSMRRTPVDLLSMRRLMFRPSRSSCASILTSSTKGPLTA